MGLFVSWFYAICIVVPTLILWAEDAQAVELQVTPSIAIREEYTDNIVYTSGEKDGSFISTISPGLEFRRKTELIDAYLSARADGVEYLGEKYDDMDTVDHFYTLGFGHQFSDRLLNKIDLKYTKDSRTDRDIEDTGLFLTASQRERQGLSLSSNYSVSENTRTNFSYSYNRDIYEDPKFFSFKAHAFNVGLTSDLSEFIDNFTGQTNLGYYRYDYSGFYIGNYSLTLGASWRYSNTLKFDFNVGPRYTRSEFDTNELLFGLPTGRIVNAVNGGWGVNGGLSVNYAGLFSTWKISLSQEVGQSSGRNGASERTKAIVEIGRRISESFRFNLMVSYYWNRSKEGEFSNSELDTRTWQIYPQCNYLFSKHFSLNVSYKYSKIEVKDRDSQIERNTVFLNLRYEFPLFD